MDSAYMMPMHNSGWLNVDPELMWVIMCGWHYLLSMLQCCDVEMTLAFITQLLLGRADIQVCTVGPLLGQYRAIMRTLGKLPGHFLQRQTKQTSVFPSMSKERTSHEQLQIFKSVWVVL